MLLKNMIVLVISFTIILFAEKVDYNKHIDTTSEASLDIDYNNPIKTIKKSPCYDELFLLKKIKDIESYSDK